MPSKKSKTAASAKKPVEEPEEEPEEEVSPEERKRLKRHRRLQNAKKVQSGYRLRAVKAGSVKDIHGRIFSVEDIRRCSKFVPPCSALSYDLDEFQYRATVAATPLPASVAFSLGPSVDSLARHIVNTAAVASYTAGRPSCTPWDLLCASRTVLGCLDFSTAFPEGAIRFGQEHDSRGDKVSERRLDENARLPIVPYGDDDSGVAEEDGALLEGYAAAVAKIAESASKKRKLADEPPSEGSSAPAENTKKKVK